MYAQPSTENVKADQPLPVIVEAAGLYFRSITLEREGDVVPQHTHDHHHVTLVGHGRARCWQHGVWVGDRSCGEVFEVRAGAEHVFQALEDRTVLICVHDIASAESVKAKEAPCHSVG